MEHQEAGYFIHDWQELRDQVRQMIKKDDRYKAIKSRKVQLEIRARRRGGETP